MALFFRSMLEERRESGERKKSTRIKNASKKSAANIGFITSLNREARSRGGGGGGGNSNYYFR